jgi:hypothetical protein
MRGPGVVGILARHRLFRKCAVGVLYPVAVVRLRNAPTQRRKELESEMDQICPKCATGICPWRDGIMCRNYVCERDDANKGMEDLLKGLPPGFDEIFRGLSREGDKACKVNGGKS